MKGIRRHRPSSLLPRVICAVLPVVAAATPASTQIIAPPGYVYSPQLLESPTQSCVAAGPGGTFVGIGPGFTANGQAVVLAKESGEVRLVAFGFNSIGDCAYDRTRDVLYVTDNAAAAETPGALSGDTIFSIPSASTAAGVMAAGSELLPAGSLPSASSVSTNASGDVFVADAAGGGVGTVVKIDVDAGPAASSFATGLDFTGGLAFDPLTGDLLVAETTSSFESRIRRFDSTGGELPLFAGPGSGFGSFDLAFNTDGNLLTTGAFFGDVVAFDPSGTPAPFVGGLTFATGVTVNAFTGRVELLSTASATDEDRSIHRFTPVSRLLPGGRNKTAECISEYYGLALVPPAPGKKARKAVCVDGAPCDADGKVNDSCLFPVGFCLNVPDPRFPACSATGDVQELTVTTRPLSPAVLAAGDAIRAALPISGETCFFSDGFDVPIKIKTSGKKPGIGRVAVKAEGANGEKDVDSVALVCEPASF